MKSKLIVAACIVALSASTAHAAKPNNNGCGGQAIKNINSIITDIPGLTWGKWVVSQWSGKDANERLGGLASHANSQCN